MESIQLLQQASAEIKQLRRSNEQMKLRLDMFDDVMRLLYANLSTRGSCMSIDLAASIDKFIEANESKTK